MRVLQVQIHRFLCVFLFFIEFGLKTVMYALSLNILIYDLIADLIFVIVCVPCKALIEKAFVARFIISQTFQCAEVRNL